MLVVIRYCWLVLVLFGLHACRAEFRIGNPIELPDERLEYTYDFESGAQGWRAGFSDYDTELSAFFSLQSGVRSIPNTGQDGFYLAGTNRSDDLFMFIKIRLTGLTRVQRYRADVTLDMVSNAGENCVGAGGPPGEAVYVKFGFAEIEPAQAGYYLNVDKGNQSTSGTNANVIGNVASAQSDCSGQTLGRKTLQTTASNSLEFSTDSQGRIWLFVGTDSGFEGRTEIYYDRVTITLSAI